MTHSLDPQAAHSGPTAAPSNDREVRAGPVSSLLLPELLARRSPEERGAFVTSLSHAIGNVAVTRYLARAGPAAAVDADRVEVDFDPVKPWMFRPRGPLTEETVVQALYGGATPPAAQGWVVVPGLLVEPYRGRSRQAPGRTAATSTDSFRSCARRRVTSA